jgi:hypothetical protein
MTAGEVRFVPRVSLWNPDGRGPFIVLECVCGSAVPYPGHPDEIDRSECAKCGRLYERVEPEQVPRADT